VKFYTARRNFPRAFAVNSNTEREDTMSLDPRWALATSERLWEEAMPTFFDLTRIPNVSSLFDPDWQEHGHMQKAFAVAADWWRQHPIPGLIVEEINLNDENGNPYTPVLFMEASGDGVGTVLMYWHLDVQPGGKGWKSGRSAWEPVRDGGVIYCRGGADDKYATFASRIAIEICAQQAKFARIVVIAEGAEESGSAGLPDYVEHLAPRIGTPDLIICLDSGSGNYEQLCTTVSLRGLENVDVRVDVLEEGIHSGASGIVPSTSRILRGLINRFEDTETGVIQLPDLFVPVPDNRMQEILEAAAAFGTNVWEEYPFVPGCRPVSDNIADLLLARSWHPKLEQIGGKGIPSEDSEMGNVLRAWTEARLSVRLPPTLDVNRAFAATKAFFESNPLYGARVTCTASKLVQGWNAPPFASWLEASQTRASNEFFDKPAVAMGEGGAIPFMQMLGQRYPKAQFFITGVLGPHSNAHGPNECFNLDYAKRVTCCVAQVIADHAAQSSN